MRDAYYVVMCFLHRIAKKLLKKHREPIGLRFVDVTDKDIREGGTVVFQGLPNSQVRDVGDGKVSISQLYPVENACPKYANPHLQRSFTIKRVRLRLNKGKRFSPNIWRSFINRSEIPIGYRNEGLRYAGYIASGRESWCLPSWIWTNAAIVRYFCSAGEIDRAVQIGARLLAKQDRTGGWVVRSDYTVTGEVPVLAPNDSAYIANNALLELYKATGNEIYLDSAIRCADWIIASARPDGLVWTGFGVSNSTWLKDYTIVDTGFTAGLFASLYMLTADDRYRRFLRSFIRRFVEVFYDPKSNLFATSIDKNNKMVGGRFARGQAWALEGLIPAYTVLRAGWIKEVILENTKTIISKQLSNGGWPYNFHRAYLGEDCKGVPVLAKALLDWHRVQNDQRLVVSAQNALNWATYRTSLYGDSKGGIFSYNSEGAVVHNFYTKTAFVYSTVYALEAWADLNEYH